MSTSLSIRTAVLLASIFLAAPALAADTAKLEWDDLDGRRVSLDSLHGSIIVLNFWATWCKPCVEEMPDLEQIHADFGPLGVRVVGASADEARAADGVRRFARRHDITFPLLLGATTHQMIELGLPASLPGTVILDGDGKVARRYPGVIERREVERVLRALLDGKPLAPEDAGEPAEGHEEDAHAHDRGERHDHGSPTEASLVPS